ncbi:MAG: dephospho-CoA kinase [Limisphaerales bacterium]
MKLFGITGGIGMGKSTSGRLLAECGRPVSDTDLIARQVVEPGQPALHEIKKLFGAQLLDPGGRLRREELAQIVFGDGDARQKLEAILHPPIRQCWQSEVQKWREENRPFGFVIIPLLFETGAGSLFDATICVACSAASQRKRLAERDWNEEQIEQRIAAQWPAEKKINLSDFVVWTDGSLEMHAKQLERIYSRFF